MPTVDAATIADYEQRGHAVVRAALSPDELADAREVVPAATAGSRQRDVPLERRSTYQRAFVQEMNLWQRFEAVRPLVFSPRLAARAAALLGVDHVRIYHDQALSKEPHGGATPWHVDQQYWPLATDKTITAWIPLQDVPAPMGPLRFARASHDIAAARDLPISDESERMITDEIATRRLVIDETEYALGDVSFHGGWTFHGARGNRTDAWRHVLTVIYFADGTCLAPPARPEQEFDRRTWLPDSEVGRPIDSWLNPVVVDGVIARLPPPAPMVGTARADDPSARPPS
jgi:ectoine hydroxylase-related dioxygenase (phytanoyl-CoA dioxygenase family)